MSSKQQLPPVTADDLEYTSLTMEHAEDIIRMTKHVYDGGDFVPKCFEGWVKSSISLDEPKQAHSSVIYGAFLKPEKKIVGCNMVAWLTDEIAWLQALRVDQAQQKRGIARLMFEYGINYSIAAGAKRLRYATSSNNTASLALGARFGFAQIARRNVLNAKIADLKVPDAPIGPINHIGISDALALVRKFAGQDKEDSICVGWGFYPIDEEVVINEAGEQVKTGFFTNANNTAVLLRLLPPPKGSQTRRDCPSEDAIWLVPYGQSEEAVQQLFLDFLVTIKTSPDYNNVTHIIIYVKEEIAEWTKTLGLKYWHTKPIQVVLLDREA